VEYIFEKFTSHKFRSTGLLPEIEKNIRTCLQEKIKQNKPIIFAIPTGGYKKRQWAMAPFIDWAEVFNVIQMAEYAAHVLAVYPPGVSFEYVSNEIDMELLGNYTREELKSYTLSFQEMLDYIKKYLPGNLNIIYREMRDQFIRGEYEECLNKALPDLEHLSREWDQLSEDDQQKHIEKSGRNYKFSEDQMKLSDKEKYEILKKTSLLHDMYVRPIWLSFMAKKNYIRNDNKIPVSFYHSNWGIHLKSSPSSTVQFWVGKGVLFKKSEEYLMSILTSLQFKSLKSRISLEKVDIFPKKLSNLKEITVIGDV